MNLSTHLQRVQCSACGWQRVFGPEEMLQLLRGQGKLRRETQPASELIRQLFDTVLPQSECPDCRHRGLTQQPLDDSAAAWGDARRCELCRNPIPAERLEVFPRATRCASCQDRPSGPSGADDFCPRCGGVLKVRASNSAGIARYITACPDCGYRG